VTKRGGERGKKIHGLYHTCPRKGGGKGRRRDVSKITTGYHEKHFPSAGEKGGKGSASGWRPNEKKRHPTQCHSAQKRCRGVIAAMGERGRKKKRLPVCRKGKKESGTLLTSPRGGKKGAPRPRKKKKSITISIFLKSIERKEERPTAVYKERGGI